MTINSYLATGKNIAAANASSPVGEIGKLLLHRLVTGYGPEHYLAYSLFSKPVDLRAWRQYLDKRDFCKLLFRYNKKTHFAILEDKVAFGDACQRHALPHPDIAFTCNYAGRDFPFANIATGNLAAGFAALAAGDYIVKTCGGSYGINLWSVTKTADGVEVHNTGQMLSPQDFAAVLTNSGDSYLVQAKIDVASSLRAIMPGRACGSMRIHTFLRPDGTVALPYGMIKLTRLGAISDNFVGGASGNMLAMINMSNHSIQRVVSKAANGLYSEVIHHPDTGVDLRDYPVPELQQALDLGRHCALAFPDIPAVGWDIVVTDNGPVVLEGNPMFDPAGPQLCADRGVRDIMPELLGR